MSVESTTPKQLFIIKRSTRSSGGFRQVLLDKTQKRLHQRLARIRILGHEHRADGGMRSGDRYRERPVVGVDITHEGASGHDLVIEDHLAVVARVDAGKFIVARCQN